MGKKRSIRIDCDNPGAGYTYTLDLRNAVNSQHTSMFPKRIFRALKHFSWILEKPFPYYKDILTRSFSEILGTFGFCEFLETSDITTISIWSKTSCDDTF